MPKILKRLTAQLRGDSKTATKALQNSGNLVKGTQLPTAQGIRRGNMSPADRALNSAVIKSGGTMSDYVYNPQTNRTKKRK